MADTDRPNRQSNMEKAEGDRDTAEQWEAERREPDRLVQRHPYPGDPTKLDTERTADEQSTVRNSGLATGSDKDPVMPSDDATAKTKI
jgi:hypothetical protein